MKKRTIIISLLSLILICGLGTILYQLFFNNKSVTITNGIISSDQLIKKDFKSSYTSSYKFEDMKVTDIPDITLTVLNNPSSKDVPILLKAQRYYIPLPYICDKLGFTSENESDNIIIKNNTNTIKLTDSSYKSSSKEGSLRGNLLHKNGITYISVSDIEEVFNLTALFNFEQKSINFFPYNIEAPKNIDISKYTNVAFIRFEDFTTTSNYSTDKTQAKLKCLTNFVYSNHIKFHVAWIPRYVDLASNTDDNLLENTSIETVGFINVLDYFINHGGEIGLHGYTHQSGDRANTTDAEISSTVNSSPTETRNVIENAIDVASALNIPCTFFETPHYMETAKQKSIIEDYFQYIYEPFNPSNVNNIYNDGNHLFLATPLGYVQNEDASSITDQLKNSNPKVVNSFFYHLYMELKYIDYNTDNNTINVQYDNNSPLHKIVNSLDENNITTFHIDELKQ